MVALNTAYAPSETSTRSENRVGDFFWQGGDPVGSNRPASRIGTKEKRGYGYETASGRPYWPSRDPIEERGGLNVYVFVDNNSLDYWDYLGQKRGRRGNRGGGNGGSRVEPQGISFVFSQSLSVTGCFPTATPGVVVCASGGWTATAGKCTDEPGAQRQYVTLEGTVRFFARFGGRPGGSWTYRKPIIKDERCCPKAGGDFGGGMFVRAEIGPLSAGCSLTVSYSNPNPVVRCYGGLRAGFAAKLQVDVGGQVGGKLNRR